MTALDAAALAAMRDRAASAAALTTDKKLTYRKKLWAQAESSPALAADVLALLAEVARLNGEIENLQRAYNAKMQESVRRQ